MKALKHHFSEKNFVISFTSGVLFLAVSLVIQFFASNYTARIASDSVTDIILSNTRVYDVGGIFVWGAIILVIFSLALAVRHINYTPFAVKSVALFTIIRSIFITLTHVGPFPTHALINSVFFKDAVFSGIFSGNDLFFSGHTGVPFLLALMFWHHKTLRYIFLGFSIVFAVVVLLGHLHYSIDVLAAYFITYTIYHMCRFFFKKDWELFLQN